MDPVLYRYYIDIILNRYYIDILLVSWWVGRFQIGNFQPDQYWDGMEWYGMIWVIGVVWEVSPTMSHKSHIDIWRYYGMEYGIPMTYTRNMGSILLQISTSSKLL